MKTLRIYLALILVTSTSYAKHIDTKKPSKSNRKPAAAVVNTPARATPALSYDLQFVGTTFEQIDTGRKDESGETIYIGKKYRFIMTTSDAYTYLDTETWQYDASCTEECPDPRLESVKTLLNGPADGDEPVSEISWQSGVKLHYKYGFDMKSCVFDPKLAQGPNNPKCVASSPRR